MSRLLLLIFPRSHRAARGHEMVSTLREIRRPTALGRLVDLADATGYALRLRFGLLPHMAVGEAVSTAAPFGLAIAGGLSLLSFVLVELPGYAITPPAWLPYQFGPFATTGVLVYGCVTLGFACYLVGAMRLARLWAVMALSSITVCVFWYRAGGPARPDGTSLIVLAVLLMPLLLAPTARSSPSHGLRTALVVLAAAIVLAGELSFRHLYAGPGGLFRAERYYQGSHGLTSRWVQAQPLLAALTMLTTAVAGRLRRSPSVCRAGYLILLPCAAWAYGGDIRYGRSAGPFDRVDFLLVAALVVAVLAGELARSRVLRRAERHLPAE